MIEPIRIPEALATLGRLYESAGHEIWLVGGCVRDHVLDLPSKDIDLATSATPEEQVALYEANGYHWIGTGLQHGTITVIAGGEPYEITTFRTDVETDGRHALIQYSKDLEVDLARRDLRFNAIAMAFDGRVVDPYDGIGDARAGKVRFVGEPGERIREDYLRIMRWFRFLGRFGETLDRASPDAEAVRENAAGMSRISVERVWSEMQRILQGPRPGGIVDMMWDLGVLSALDIPRGDADGLANARRHTDNPALLLAVWLGTDAPAVARAWKTSNAEQEAVAFAANRLTSDYTLEAAKLDMVDGVPTIWVDKVLRIQGNNGAIRALIDWTVPTFPVAGRDLVQAGMPAGKEIGERLRMLRAAWIASDYTLEQGQLVAMAA